MIDVLLAAVCAGALDRWLGDRSHIDPLPWYREWVDSIELRFNGGEFFHGLSAFVLAVVPVLLVILLARWVAWQFGVLIGFAFDVVVLFLCIRIDWLHQSASAVGHALKHGRLLDAQSALRKFEGITVTDENEQTIAETTVEAILCKANSLVVSPLFWFVVLGPAGSMLQLLSNVVSRRWRGQKDRFGQFGLAARHTACALNWLPARITVAGYALAGSFSDAIHRWRDSSSYWCNSDRVLANSGFAALQIQRGDEEHEGWQAAQAGHVRRAVALAWRALLLLALLLCLMGLASWFHF